MGDSPFLSFAARHDLDFAEKVAGGAVPSKGVSEVAGGSLPGGLEGVVARYEQEVKTKFLEDSAGNLRRETAAGSGASAPQSRYFRDSCMLLTRVPESTGFLPYITCRDSVVRGVADRLIGPGGLIPLVDHIEFESIELNRRYRIGAFKGYDNRLRQLFAPSLIDWMASSAPEGLYFELFGGSLMLTLTGYVEGEEQIGRTCELASHLVEVIRSEATESHSPDGTPEYSIPPQQLEVEQKRADTLAAAAFTSPPNDLKSAIERIEPVVGEKNKGFLRRVFKSINKDETTSLALEALIRGYGQRHAMEWERGSNFQGRHVDLPMPIAPIQLLHGPVPGVGPGGDLFVCGSGALALATDCYPGAALPVADSPAVLQVAPPPEEEQSGEPMVMGGFPVHAGEGARRLSQESKGDAEVAATIESELDGRYRVVAHRCEPGKTLTPAMRDWLLAEERVGRCMLQRAAGTLAVLSSPKPVEEWSVASLDSFCESLRPLVG